MQDIDFWGEVGALEFSSEADVETRLVIPLLAALGHQPANVVSKPSIDLYHGSKRTAGRGTEADFVVYAGKPFGRATSLMVVEAKRPDIDLIGAAYQAESYAIALRAPLILLTNGRTVELFQLQPAGENVLVFACAVNELASRAGELESLASPAAAALLCSRLEHKNLAVLAQDVTAFESAELDRLPARGAALDRRLRDRAIQKIAMSSGLLEAFPEGALVLGPSGYGKTTLAETLTRELIERRQEGRSQRLVFNVFLPDVSVDPEGFERYLSDRIVKHVPQISLLNLRGRLRESGAAVVADGYDRVAEELRDAIDSAMRNFARDFPKSAFYVLSRPFSERSFGMGLPVLDLEPYADTDFQRLRKLRGIKEPQYLVGNGRPPELIGILSREPLLADLILDHIDQTSRYPTRLPPLYEDWLSEVLARFDDVEAAEYRAFLSDLAVATRNHPASMADVLRMASRFGEPRAVLKALLRANAISIRQTTVELSHEALADYLRAKRFNEDPGSDLSRKIRDMSFEAASHFPHLVLATARTAADSREIWRGLVAKSLPAALRAAQYSHHSVAGANRAQTVDFLHELLEGFDAIVQTHFPALEPALNSVLAMEEVDSLGVAGQMADGRLSYSFFNAGPGRERVRIMGSERYRRQFGINLGAYGMGTDAGRLVGAKSVRFALQQMLLSRAVKGGRIWKEELVHSRLNGLMSLQRLQLERPFDLALAWKRLQALAGDYTWVSPAQVGMPVRISDLIADIEFLQARGVRKLEPWWCDVSSLDLRRDRDRVALAKSLDTLHVRRQNAYAEVVEASFPSIALLLRDFRNLPVRQTIEIGPQDGSGPFSVFQEYRERPVASFADAGADVSFVSELGTFPMPEEERISLHQKNVQAISDFGQSRASFITHSGWSRVPEFLVRRYSGDGIPGETAVVRDVMASVESDLGDIFKDVPLL